MDGTKTDVCGAFVNGWKGKYMNSQNFDYYIYITISGELDQEIPFGTRTLSDTARWFR